VPSASGATVIPYWLLGTRNADIWAPRPQSGDENNNRGQHRYHDEGSSIDGTEHISWIITTIFDRILLPSFRPLALRTSAISLSQFLVCQSQSQTPEDR
jgi:hypothetical protein